MISNRNISLFWFYFVLKVSDLLKSGSQLIQVFLQLKNALYPGIYAQTLLSVQSCQ